MKRYTDKFIKEVRKARKKERLSFSQLGRDFRVPSNTVRNWCHDLGGTKWETLIRTNENKRKQFKASEILVVPKATKISINEAKFLVGILYGCEGSKYPSTNSVSFSNSDPSLVLTFLCLFRKAFVPTEKKFSVHLQIHTTHNYQSLRNFWSNYLGIPKEQFIKPTVREPKGKKHRNKYMGTCTLKYRDYRIQLKLLGIFEKFINSFRKQ